MKSGKKAAPPSKKVFESAKHSRQNSKFFYSDSLQKQLLLKIATTPLLVKETSKRSSRLSWLCRL